MTKKAKLAGLRIGAAPIVLGLALISAPTFAQVAPGATAAGDQGAADIVVTGSRIPQPNLSSTSPVTVIGAQEVKLQGVTRTEDLINNLPQAFAGQGGNIANGATGTATLDLRGLGSARTLVLVNGRRLLPGDPRSPVADINTIPSSLIKRVDVLTGGASSVYGADAVSGVVNFVMDTDFEGIRADAQYSFYQHKNRAGDLVNGPLDARGFDNPKGNVTDGGTFDASLAIGAGFDDNRGHVTAYVGYRKIRAILQANRDYSACSLTANTPAQIAARGNRLMQCGGSATSANGTFFDFFAKPDDPTTPIVTAPDGTVTGNEFGFGSSTYQIGNGNQFVPGFTPYNFAPTNYYQRPDQRYTAGFFANYEISPAIKPYMEAMFMDDRTVAQIAASGDFGNTSTINCDNPLLSAQQLGIICRTDNLVGFSYDDPTTAKNEASAATVFTDALGNQYRKGNVTILRRNVEGGGRRDDLQHTSYRIVTGTKGDLDKGISYDAYFQFGRTNFAQTYRNDFSIARLTKALDVVNYTDPNTNVTSAVCRSVVDGSDPNCVPYNVFQTGGVDPAALGYLQTPGFARGQTQETIVSGSVTVLGGEYGIQSPWAADGVALNLGAEYRKEGLNFEVDNAFKTGDLAGQGGATLPVEGSFSVKEAFGEVRVPLISDKPFFDSLTFGAAYRYSKYTVPKTATSPGNSFSTNTYKFEADWAPTPDFRLRASYNRAVRAPNVVELFSTAVVGLDGNDDPCAGDTPRGTRAECALTGVTASQYGNIAANPANQYNGLLGGDVGLEPEKATTKTVGLVFTPTFLRGFSATVDYFDIKVNNAISSFGGDNILNQCIATGQATFCDLIKRDNRGSLWLSPEGFVVDLNRNIGGVSTRGIDVGASYTREFDFGTIGLSVVGTWLDQLKTDQGFGVEYDCAGYYGLQCGTPNPEWRHKARLSFTLPSGPGLSLSWRYFSGVKLDSTSPDSDLAAADPAKLPPQSLRIKSQSYFDLVATMPLGDHFNFRLGANNILDKSPPIVGSNALTSVRGNGNTFPQVYDALGRYIYAGISLDF